MENSELKAKVQQWLRDVSRALHRLSHQRQVLRGTKAQTIMGAVSVDHAETSLSRFAQWRHEDRNGLPADIVSRLPRAGL